MKMVIFLMFWKQEKVRHLKQGIENTYKEKNKPDFSGLFFFDSASGVDAV